MSTKSDVKTYRRIRCALVGRGVTFAAIARRLKVTRCNITLVAKGQRVSRRIRRALARACSLRMEELWQ
jgi:transcriptional regulator